MKEITSEQFHNAVAELSNFGTERVDARPDYIGRGMGWPRAETCVGIVGEHTGRAGAFIIAIAEQLSPGDIDDQKSIFVEMLTDMVTDGMGKNHKIYYFPGWKIVD